MMLLNALTKVIYTALRDRYGLHYLSTGAAAATAVINSYSVKKMEKAEISSDSDEYEQNYSS